METNEQDVWSIFITKNYLCCLVFHFIFYACLIFVQIQVNKKVESNFNTFTNALLKSSWLVLFSWSTLSHLSFPVLKTTYSDILVHVPFCINNGKFTPILLSLSLKKYHELMNCIVISQYLNLLWFKWNW